MDGGRKSFWIGSRHGDTAVLADLAYDGPTTSYAALATIGKQRRCNQTLGTLTAVALFMLRKWSEAIESTNSGMCLR